MLWIFAQAGLAQTLPRFQSGVSLVHVDVAVASKEGRIVEGLSKGDFRAFDEGREQPIVAFTAEEQPLDLILLFDVSGSMRRNVQGVAGAADQAFHELRSGDRVAVLTFSTQTNVISSVDEDLLSTEAAIQKVLKLRFGGGTLIQQAIDEAALYMLRLPRNDRRRAILVITDNIGFKSRNTPAEISIIRDLWEADAVLSGLLFTNPTFENRRATMPPWILKKIAGMEHIAEQTGGDAIRADDPASDFPEMMHRIRTRYSLYYPAPSGKSGEFRQIRIELTDAAKQRWPEAMLMARHGYRVQGR